MIINNAKYAQIKKIMNALMKCARLVVLSRLWEISAIFMIIVINWKLYYKSLFNLIY